MTQDILDIYDSELEKILALQAELNDKIRFRKLNYGDFEREIRERFGELGFTVNVSWYRYSVGGQEQEGAMPEVTVTGRTDGKFAFDPDRQVHEVTRDILGTGDEGVIKTDPDTLKNFLEGQSSHGRHRH